MLPTGSWLANAFPASRRDCWTRSLAAFAFRVNAQMPSAEVADIRQIVSSVAE
jgi:hypothetical protein